MKFIHGSIFSDTRQETRSELFWKVRLCPWNEFHDILSLQESGGDASRGIQLRVCSAAVVASWAAGLKHYGETRHFEATRTLASVAEISCCISTKLMLVTYAFGIDIIVFPLFQDRGRGPRGTQIRRAGCNINSKTCPKSTFWHLGSKRIKTKLGFRARIPHSEIGAGILRRTPVSTSQMVVWRPTWWQKGVLWGPLGFWA